MSGTETDERKVCKACGAKQFITEMAFGYCLPCWEKEKVTPAKARVRVTIVTIYRGGTAETYVAAVLGSVSAEERGRLTEAFGVNTDEDDDEHDTIGFQEVDAVAPGELSEVLQAFP